MELNRLYENAKNSKINKFFDKTDWNNRNSTIEQLPYLAKMLKENTPKISNIHYDNKELFKFVQKEN